MLIEHPGLRKYLLSALEATPGILEHLLHGLCNEEADFRPDAARFSIREVMAHLADWDAIFLERLQRTRDEEEPLLEDLDEGQLAVERDYAHADLLEQSRIFRERRAQTVEFARTLSPHEWQCPCQHQRVGRLTLEALATLIPLHDAYHLQQVVEWRRLYEEERR